MGRGGLPVMIRVLIDPEGSHAERIPLSETERHHLKVRRVADGTRLQALDGSGNCLETILHIDGAESWLEPVSLERAARGPTTVLLVAVGDRDRFGWLVEKAVELGVTDLFPIRCARSESVASRVREKHLPALQTRARETLKQCGVRYVPVIHPIRPVAETIAALPSGVRWIMDMVGDPSPTVPPRDTVCVAIGPEGGLSDTERAQFQAAGFCPVRVGATTLRFETAALAAAAIIVNCRGGAL